MKRNFVYIIVLVIVATIFLVPGLKDKIQEAFFPVATIEKTLHVAPEDYDIELKGINTASTNLKNFKGKPLFLNFWGTWCAPCRKEWPSIQKLYDARKNQLGFVLIAMEDQEEDIRKFLKENNYTVPVYIAESPISEKILPKVFPTTFLLDNTGRILMKEDATKDWNSESVHQFINSTIK